MNRKFQSIVLLVGAATLALATPALSAPRGKGGGGGRPAASGARSGGGGGGNRGGGVNREVRSASNSSVNRGGNNNRRGNTNVSGNTVVVNKGNNRGGGGYNNGYNNGYHGGGGGYYNNGHWEDDNDFGEFLGKTMAITAGAAIVTSIATSGGKTTNNGQECTQQISNGMAYVNCGGTWYAPVQNGTQTGYQAVPAPR